MSDNKLNVLDMIKTYTNNNSPDVGDLFAKPKKDEQEIPVQEKPPIPPTEEIKQDSSWSPDPKLLEGMDEMKQHSGAVYKKDEMIQEKENLENIMDADAKEAAVSSKNEMERIQFNIEEAKKRHSIKYLKIPEGYDQVNIINAASDTSYKKAQEGIDEIFADLKDLHPEFFIYENDEVGEDNQQAITGDDTPDNTNIKAKYERAFDEEHIQIVIDKRNVSQISFSDEEIRKISKARTVELNIVETDDIEYSQIKNIPENMVDRVLEKYTRKPNDQPAALPASKYRATFSGLSYPEMIDLDNSFEMNNIDGERKKWSICFDHIHNQSIGPWESYVWFIEPETDKKVKCKKIEDVPATIERERIHVVTEFEDFLMKTSFIDLNFMMWKILCATSMNTEIISIDCKSIKKGVRCGNHYDWVYSPKELLDIKSISEVILEEMKKTAEVAGSKEIMDNYNSSMLRINNTVKLPHSGIKVIFGHISAYDYLENIYENLRMLTEGGEDPSITSKYVNYSQLLSIKAFLLPVEIDGEEVEGRIDDKDRMLQILNSLDEVDWAASTELVKMMITPYQLKFAIRDIICPKCKAKTNIEIEDLMNLFLTVARSLQSVSVKLTRN